MAIFARSRRRAAAHSTFTPTRYEFDRTEFVCFLVRMTIILGVVGMVLQSHVVH